MRSTTLVIPALTAAVLASAPASADVLTFNDEQVYLDALSALGYTTLVEGFEGADWDPYRTTDPFNPNSAPSVTSQGITWTGNEEVSTNRNWGRTNWGIFTIYGGTWTADTLFGDSVNTLFGIGGWFDSNPDFASDIAYRIHGEVLAQVNTGPGHAFLGMIDTCGFTSFDIIDAHVGKAPAWGADDFTFAVGGPPITDCNENDVADACDIATGTSTDCDGNGVPDECDLASGGGEDCNENGVLDSCDVISPYESASAAPTPIGFGAPQAYTVPAPPLAHTDVTLAFTAYANLGGAADHVAVDLNGLPVGTVFGPDGSDCPEQGPDVAALVIAAATYNGAVNGGDAVITMTATDEVAPDECDLPSFITVAVQYGVPSALDLDGNGVPDSCETAACPADLDGSNDVGFGDVLRVIGAWGPCGAPCPEDLSGNGSVDFADILAVIAAWGPC